MRSGGENLNFFEEQQKADQHFYVTGYQGLHLGRMETDV